jgi:hypothetical protein
MVGQKSNRIGYMFQRQPYASKNIICGCKISSDGLETLTVKDEGNKAQA